MNSMTLRRVTIGIAGSGGMATQRISLFNRMAGVKVSAVYARHIEKVRACCARSRAQACADYDDLLAAAEAAVICLPNHLHAAFALQALRAGRHVLVEYPLCLSPAEARVLQAAAVRNGRVLMVGNTIIHEAMFRYLMRHRRQLGALCSAASRVAFHDKVVAGCWYMNPRFTGPVFAALHYHHIEYYRHLLGAVTAVRAHDDSRPDHLRPGYKSLIGGTLHLEHAGGAASCIQWYLSAAGRGSPRGLWLNGAAGSLTVVSHGPAKSQVIWNGGETKANEVYIDDWGVAGSCRDFIAAIRGQLDHHARLQSDMQTLSVGWRAAESARLGRRLTC
ncbi:MAG: Gfo/Idh/MocA family oxidoreductase [Verrucomicrobia bacterium]|nr:Gfo/Idh/MocA family oxidoreductase [Verrucomicrobiota bacterium]